MKRYRYGSLAIREDEKGLLLQLNWLSVTDGKRWNRSSIRKSITLTAYHSCSLERSDELSLRLTKSKTVTIPVIPALKRLPICVGFISIYKDLIV